MKPRPLPPPAHLGRQMLVSSAAAAGLLAVGLSVGTVGYHVTEGQPWLDALVDASMILTGMGPVHLPTTVAGKWFSAVYAVFSGVFFLTTTGVLTGPLVARFLHRLHLDIHDG